MAILLHPKVYSVLVYEHLWAIEELWNQLPHICMVIESTLKGFVYRVEASVRCVQILSMQLNQSVDVG